MDDRQRVEYALGRYLSVRPRSEQEVRRYLQLRSSKYSLNAEIIEELVQKYSRLGYINDQLFAESMAHAMVSKAKGQKLLSMKLKQAGVSEDIIAASLTSLDPEDIQSAMQKRLRKYEQKWSELDDFTHRAKAYEKLLQAGFSSSEIRSFLDDWLKKE